LILADEPTGSLATEQGMAIIEFLHESVTNDGLSVVIASHDERIMKYADRVHRLRDGFLL
jgi:putative ABC transport system ATP-binding protein